MRISDHPRASLAVLVGVFFLVFALSLYFSDGSADGVIQVHSNNVTAVTSGHGHIIYVHYYVYSSNSSTTSTYYTTSPCIYHD